MKLLLKRFKYLLPLLISSGLALSCGSHKDNPEIEHKPLVSPLAFCNRECNYVGIGAVIDHTDTYSVVTGTPVKAEEVRFEVFTLCDEQFLQPDYMMENACKKEFNKQGDKIIEEQIVHWFEMQRDEAKRLYIASFEESDPQDINDLYEYRSDYIEKMTLRSSAPLFGRGNNSDISDKLVFCELPLRNNHFIFTYDKELIGQIEKGMPLTDYLAYKPMILPLFDLSFSELPPELPVETDLTVEMTLGNGKTLSDTVHVKLTE